MDVFRGLLIAHMALDHASLMLNAGRGAEELWRKMPGPSADIFQFLTRFTGVPVAPGFCFMAGFMVALTSFARETRGVPDREITKKLLVRGLVLILVDTTIMGVPRVLSGFYSFMVLSSIGVSIVLVALLRKVPSTVLLPAALAVLVLHPLLDVSGLPVPLQAVLHEPVRTGGFRSLYPVIPWSAIVVTGFVAGRDVLRRERPAPFWLALAGACLLAFFVVRVRGGYGNAYPTASIATETFWSFAKYPPDLPFLTWSFACVLATLAALHTLTKRGVPGVLRAFTIFGRVPFFFYVTHFYVMALGAGLVWLVVRHKVGLLATYGAWLVLLLVMLPLCAWYDRKKRQRPNFVTRYL